MATHSSILAWKIPWTEEPGGLQSMGLQRVGHDWACTHMHARAHTHTHTHALFLKFICTVVGSKLHFLLKVNISLYVHATICFSISLLMYIGCLHLLALVNNTAVNIAANICPSSMFKSFGHIPRRGVVESYGNSVCFLSFASKALLFSLHQTASFCIPTSEDSNFSTSSPNLIFHFLML